MFFTDIGFLWGIGEMEGMLGQGMPRIVTFMGRFLWAMGAALTISSYAVAPTKVSSFSELIKVVGSSALTSSLTDCSWMITGGIAPSQTDAHLWITAGCDVSSIAYSSRNNSCAALVSLLSRNELLKRGLGEAVGKILDQARDAERGFIAFGLTPYVFYHATPIKIYLSCYAATQLIKRKYCACGTAIIFRPETFYQTIEHNIWKQCGMREQLLANGVVWDHDFDSRRLLISANGSLVGNLHDLGECTISYWITGRTAGGSFKLDFNNLIKGLGGRSNLSDITQLSNVIEDIDLNFSTGVMLQIALDADTVEKAVYAAYPYGIKANYFNGVACAHTGNVRQLLDGIRKGYSSFAVSDNCEPDNWQFRIILTSDIMLNPHKLFDVSRMNRYCVDEAKLKQLEQKIDALVDVIAKKSGW